MTLTAKDLTTMVGYYNYRQNSDITVTSDKGGRDNNLNKTINTTIQLQIIKNKQLTYKSIFF